MELSLSPPSSPVPSFFSPLSHYSDVLLTPILHEEDMIHLEEILLPVDPLPDNHIFQDELSSNSLETLQSDANGILDLSLVTIFRQQEFQVQELEEMHTRTISSSSAQSVDLSSSTLEKGKKISKKRVAESVRENVAKKRKSAAVIMAKEQRNAQTQYKSRFVKELQRELFPESSMLVFTSLIHALPSSSANSHSQLTRTFTFRFEKGDAVKKKIVPNDRTFCVLFILGFINSLPIYIELPIQYWVRKNRSYENNSKKWLANSQIKLCEEENLWLKPHSKLSSTNNAEENFLENVLVRITGHKHFRARVPCKDGKASTAPKNPDTLDVLPDAANVATVTFQFMMPANFGALENVRVVVCRNNGKRHYFRLKQFDFQSEESLFHNGVKLSVTAHEF